MRTTEVSAFYHRELRRWRSFPRLIVGTHAPNHEAAIGSSIVLRVISTGSSTEVAIVESRLLRAFPSVASHERLEVAVHGELKYRRSRDQPKCLKDVGFDRYWAHQSGR